MNAPELTPDMVEAINRLQRFQHALNELTGRSVDDIAVRELIQACTKLVLAVAGDRIREVAQHDARH